MPIPVNIRKVNASEVPYGMDIARGPWVYAVYDTTEKLLGVYATMKEAKRKHSVWRHVPKEEQRIMNKRRYQTLQAQGGRGLPKSHGGGGWKS